MRPAVFVAGPYRGAGPEDILRNVQRACAVGGLAARRGFTPHVPHALGFLGVFGAGTGGDDAETEARAIDCSTSMVFALAGAEVRHPSGRLDQTRASQLWVIRSDDSTLSAGTQREVDTWDGLLCNVVVRTWAEWEREIAGEVSRG